MGEKESEIEQQSLSKALVKKRACVRTTLWNAGAVDTKLQSKTQLAKQQVDLQLFVYCFVAGIYRGLAHTALRGKLFVLSNAFSLKSSKCVSWKKVQNSRSNTFRTNLQS